MADCIGADQVWRQLRSTPVAGARPLLCLDRDGVLVEEVNYLCRIADVAFIEGAVETIRLARAQGWGVAMVTNQAGIARGYFDWESFAAVNAHILQWLDARGAYIDLVVATPHHPSGRTPYAHPDHPMRKPNPGMLCTACDLLHGVPQASLMVGDKADDLRAGRAAGLRRGFQVLTGHGPEEQAAARALGTEHFTVEVIPDIGADRLRRALTRTLPVGAD